MKLAALAVFRMMRAFISFHSRREFIGNLTPSSCWAETTSLSFQHRQSSSQERLLLYTNDQVRNVTERGYTGLQPREDLNGTSIIHAVLSSFQGGTATKHRNCHYGANGSPGVSCSVEIKGDYNHTYNLVVENTNGMTWRGILVHTMTSNSTIIGEWLPDSWGPKTCQISGRFCRVLQVERRKGAPLQHSALHRCHLSQPHFEDLRHEWGQGLECVRNWRL